MKYENWQDTLSMVESKFNVLDKGKEAPDDVTEIEFIEFERDGQSFRLELAIKPKVIDKQTIYSRRIGSGTTEKFVYDDSEKVLTFNAFIKDPNSQEWKKVDSDIFQ